MQCSRRTPRLFPLILAVGALALAAGPARTQNLVINGTFDHDISGWTTDAPSRIMLSFRSDAGNTLPGGSGPGALEVKYTDMNSAAGPTQDIQPVTVGATYTLSGAAFIPDDESNVADSADFRIDWIGPNGWSTGSEWIMVESTERGKWLTASADVVVPGNTVAIRVAPSVHNPDLQEGTQAGWAYFDDISLVKKGSSEAKQVLFVPAAASAHGRNGTIWTTTGWFANRVGVPVKLQAAFLRQGQDNTQATSNLSSLGTIPAHGYLELEDMVATLGGAGLTGGIYIEATAPATTASLVEATSYTFTPNPGGSGGYGQGVPLTGITGKSYVIVPGVYQDARYRTNIGALNTSASQVVIDVDIHSPDGTTLGAATWTLKPYEQKQESVRDLGVNETSGGYVAFTRSGSEGSFQAYATVVDQKTGDAVYTAGR